MKRLAAVYAFFFAFVGGPIAYQTFEPTQQVREDSCWAGRRHTVLVVAKRRKGTGRWWERAVSQGGTWAGTGEGSTGAFFAGARRGRVGWDVWETHARADGRESPLPQLSNNRTA